MKYFVRIAIAGLVFSCCLWLGGQDAGGPVSPGKLSKVHAQYSGAKNCKTCHTVDKQADAGKCLKCHTDLAARINAGKGYHKDKKEDCAGCHAEHNGEDSRLIDLDTEDFDHGETGYVLTGLHKRTGDCRRCHKPPNALPRKHRVSYLLKDTRCIACHDSPHTGDRPDCAQCHDTRSWHVDLWL